ncbi:hypothetical protein [Dyella japonica]|uniref:hypothetical protein n=1 Tax=Dyella japonica TaxID=231455 RepID=UPI0011850ACC
MAVDKSVESMYQWAVHQGIAKDRIIVCSDAKGCRVTIAQIFDAIHGLPSTVEQLIVYFSGHGVINSRQEYWLLSGAPDNANEAINLEANIVLARMGRFSHVVLISDACRTQTQSIEFGQIRGSDIFPNATNASLERPVDVFFATSLGSPALEVKDETGEAYNAVFTEVLVEALNGRVAQAVTGMYVRPHPLKRALPEVVRKSLHEKGLSIFTDQTPDGRITSDESAWISRLSSSTPTTLNQSPGPTVRFSLGEKRSESRTNERTDPAKQQPPSVLAEKRVERLLDSSRDGTRISLGELEPPKSFLHSLIEARNLSPSRYRELSGLEVYGEYLGSIRFRRGRAGSQILPESFERRAVLFQDLSTPVETLLTFVDGTGTTIPLIPGYFALLRFNGSSLAEVWYEPAHPEIARVSRREIAPLRTAIADAISLGVFSPDVEGANRLADLMRSHKFGDPALAIYASYAYHQLGKTTKIVNMRRYLKNELGMDIFDAAFLSRQFLMEPRDSRPTMPTTPMLTRGWALVSALGGSHAEKLSQLRPYILPSTWSLYSIDGVRLLDQWFDQMGGELLANY